MALNKELFIKQFLDEVRDNLAIIENSIIKVKKDPENEGEINQVSRSLHSIKGSSSMLGFKNFEKIAHGLEQVFKGFKEERYALTQSVMKLIFAALETFRFGIAQIDRTKSDAMELTALLEAFEKTYANENFNLDDVLREKTLREEVEKETLQIKKDALPQEEIAPALQCAPSANDAQTIRVQTHKIDTIIQSLNTLIIRQMQLRRNLDLVDLLEESVETLSSSQEENPALQNEWRKIKKMSQNLKTNLGEQSVLIEKNTFELQEKILNLKMLPLEMILGSLPKMVEETAMALGKEIDLDIRGMDVMLDKGILEKIQDPIVHLVRNSIDHGIENPEQRQAKGKKIQGKIQISCLSESGNVQIRIEDDGGGLDYAGIRKKALERNLIREDEAETLTENELMAFLFHPGFSTRSTVSNLSGRGVGLDIVKVNIENIKGRITLASTPGLGTAFNLILPLSLATVEGFFVESCGKKFMVPSTFVEEIVILDKKDKLSLAGKPAFKLRDKIIPLHYFSDILALHESDSQSDREFVVVIESLGETIGIIVKSVIEYAALIFKPLPSNLHKLKPIQGIVFDSDYNMVNILHMPGIIEKFKSLKNIDSRKRYVKSDKKYRHILVVDDSPNTRDILKSMLELENYRVSAAVDGIDGLEKLKEKTFDLIISDLDMPRMDGFTFIENLRRNQDYQRIPIIVISSLKDQGTRQRTLDLGADAYIVKSDFEQSNLIHSVHQFIPDEIV